jgi:hypothetical protein
VLESNQGAYVEKWEKLKGFNQKQITDMQLTANAGLLCSNPAKDTHTTGDLRIKKLSREKAKLQDLPFYYGPRFSPAATRRRAELKNSSWPRPQRQRPWLRSPGKSLSSASSSREAAGMMQRTPKTTAWLRFFMPVISAHPPFPSFIPL